jgi:hypothetical protein
MEKAPVNGTSTPILRGGVATVVVGAAVVVGAVVAGGAVVVGAAVVGAGLAVVAGAGVVGDEVWLGVELGWEHEVMKGITLSNRAKRVTLSNMINLPVFISPLLKLFIGSIIKWNTFRLVMFVP